MSGTLEESVQYLLRAVGEIEEDVPVQVPRWTKKGPETKLDVEVDFRSDTD